MNLTRILKAIKFISKGYKENDHFFYATQNVGHMWKQIRQTKYQVVYKTSFKYLFLDFVNLKQNVNAQHFMHVKNHKHHTNYFYFNCWTFSNWICPM